MLKVIALAVLVSVAVPCAMAEARMGATPSAKVVSITSVSQRYPWNAKTDIAYRLMNAQNARRIVFELTDTTTGEKFSKRVDSHEAPALFTEGNHIFTWNLKDLPRTLKVSGAKVSVSVFIEG